MPAGFVHGAVLAASAVGAALVARRWNRPARWAASALVGWLGGYLSWIPLDISAFGERWPRALIWPLQNGDSAHSVLWLPFCSFGLVSMLLSLWLTRPHRSGLLLPNIVAAALAGVLGSLWWWIVWKTWHLSILHGIVWGFSVAVALSRSREG
jgi:hypothetical protein